MVTRVVYKGGLRTAWWHAGGTPGGPLGPPYMCAPESHTICHHGRAGRCGGYLSWQAGTRSWAYGTPQLIAPILLTPTSLLPSLPHTRSVFLRVSMSAACSAATASMKSAYGLGWCAQHAYIHSGFGGVAQHAFHADLRSESEQPAPCLHGACSCSLQVQAFLCPITSDDVTHLLH